MLISKDFSFVSGIPYSTFCTFFVILQEGLIARGIIFS